MKILVTGVAGFIGSKFSEELLKNKKNYIYGIDNLNSYYSVKLKKLRIKNLNKNKNFIYIFLFFFIFLIINNIKYIWTI